MKILYKLRSIYSMLTSKYNIFKWRLMGAKIGKNARVNGFPEVIGKLTNLTIGDNFSVNHGVHINCRGKITIGNNVTLSSKSQLHTGKLIFKQEPKLHVDAPIVLEDNVWIASGVIVSAGVRIAENSVVGANSVVTRDVEPNCFYAGNPAKKIKNIP